MHIPSSGRTPVGTDERFDVAGVTCELDGQPLPVVNLSAGGFFAASEVVPPAGRIVAMRLLLPDGIVVSGVGRVAWVNPAGARVHPRMPPGCGIHNFRISFTDKLTIVAALRQCAVRLARPAGGRPEVATAH